MTGTALLTASVSFVGFGATAETWPLASHAEHKTAHSDAAVTAYENIHNALLARKKLWFICVISALKGAWLNSYHFRHPPRKK